MERPWVKYGWVVFLLLGLLWLVTGLSQIFNPEPLLENDAQRITGMSWSEHEASSPATVQLARSLMGTLGNLKTSWSLLVIAITLTAYRRGRKWAWYAMWLMPVVLVTQGIFDSVFLGDVNEMLKWIPTTAVSLLGLFLPYRKFFPRKPCAHAN